MGGRDGLSRAHARHCDGIQRCVVGRLVAVDQAVLLRDSVDPTQQLQWRALRALWVVAMRVVLPGSVPATAMAVVQGWVVGRRRLPFHSDKAPVLGEALGKTWALNLSDPTVAATKLKRVEDAGRCEVVRLHGGAFDVYPNCYDLGGGTVGMRWVPFVLAEPDGVNTNDEVAHRAVRELLGLDASARPNIFVHQYHPEIMGMWGEGQTLDGADAANGVHHKRGHLANVMVSGGYMVYLTFGLLDGVQRPRGPCHVELWWADAGGGRVCEPRHCD